MNNYETIMILNDDITEEQKRNVISKIEEYITKNGKIIDSTSLGVKKLAYEVRKHSKGYYHIITFEADPQAIEELERIYRITEEVLKFIVVRKDD